MPADIAANEATIERLYAGLNAGDGEAMAACYTPDASFEDPAFGRLENGRGLQMWRMLCAAPGKIAVTLVEHRAAVDGTATAHWLADYTFTQTGREVHNDVRASFIFRDGLIAAHRDRFDLRAWAGQALGPVPALLGYTPLLSMIMHRKTSKLLEEHLAHNGAV